MPDFDIFIRRKERRIPRLTSVLWKTIFLKFFETPTKIMKKWRKK